MLKILVIVLYIQICYSSTSIEEARTQLDKLAHKANQELGKSFDDYSSMSSEIDHTALWAKEQGLKEIQKRGDKFNARINAEKARNKKCRGSRNNIIKYILESVSEDLIRCVDEQANESINVVFRFKTQLASLLVTAVAHEEKRMIVCGGSSSRCLGNTIADIKDKMAYMENLVRDEITINRYWVEVQLDLIKNCVYENIYKAEVALKNVTICIY